MNFFFFVEYFLSSAHSEITFIVALILKEISNNFTKSSSLFYLISETSRTIWTVGKIVLLLFPVVFVFWCAFICFYASKHKYISILSSPFLCLLFIVQQWSQFCWVSFRIIGRSKWRGHCWLAFSETWSYFIYVTISIFLREVAGRVATC